MTPGFISMRDNRDLFTRWPQLATHIGCEPIAELPTPVQALANIHATRAWIKCDNLTHSVYGGNKLRKLEFIIPELKKHNRKGVITLGGVGSNSGVAVAMVCQQLGIPCRIYLFDQEPNAAVAKNLRLMASYGAELIHTRNYIEAGLYYYLNWRRLDSRFYFLYAGCSNALSVFGYINALLELKKQIDTQQCPMPDTIIVPVGSCSTLAGLTLASALLNLPIAIKGVRVAPAYVGPFPGCTPGLVTALMKEALAMLSRSYPQYKTMPLPAPIMLDEYYGEAYGVATSASSVALKTAAEKENLKLDDTYTAKAFAAFLDHIDKTNDVCLFWNTHNSRDTQAQETK